MKPLTISEIADPEALTPNFQSCFMLWQQLEQNSGLPEYKSFELDKLPAALLPWTVVVDVTQDPIDYRFRFWGTERAKLIGAEMTGKMLSDISNLEMRAGNRQEYDAICERRKPLLCDTPITTATGRQLSMMSIRLPFGDVEGQVTQVLSAIDASIVTMAHYDHFGTQPRPGI